MSSVPAASSTSSKRVILVHGTGHGGWCWYRVATLLRAAGHRVDAPDLAASGADARRLRDAPTFEDYTRLLLDALRALPEGERAVLVGHSFGGMSIALAAEEFPEKVAAAVFVTAFMPDCTNPRPYVIETDSKTQRTSKLIKLKIIKLLLPITKMATPSGDGPWDFCSHEVDGEERVDILCQLMVHLGYNRHPIFRGRKTQTMDQESWTMEVFLYAREGEFNAHIFRPATPQSSCSKAVQDAARFAYARLFQMHEDFLVEMPFHYFQPLQEGEVEPEIFIIVLV